MNSALIGEIRATYRSQHYIIAFPSICPASMHKFIGQSATASIEDLGPGDIWTPFCIAHVGHLEDCRVGDEILANFIDPWLHSFKFF